eukprot:scaffold25201_cov51-Phaeocystis_antarctica.AAC.1
MTPLPVQSLVHGAFFSCAHEAAAPFSWHLTGRRTSLRAPRDIGHHLLWGGRSAHGDGPLLVRRRWRCAAGVVLWRAAQGRGRAVGCTRHEFWTIFLEPLRDHRFLVDVRDVEVDGHATLHVAGHTNVVVEREHEAVRVQDLVGGCVGGRNAGEDGLDCALLGTVDLARADGSRRAAIHVHARASLPLVAVG